MSTYTFKHTPDSSDYPEVTVTFDDRESPFIEDVLSAFEQFLLGVTFQPGSIAAYLDTEKLQSVRTDMMRRLAELKRAMAERAAAEAPKRKKSKR